MKYLIIFGLTIILALIIMFYKPFLSEYSKYVTIEYKMEEEKGYKWIYDINNDKLKILYQDKNKWKFVANKNGKTKLTFYYSNDEDYIYKIYYEFYVLGNKILWLKGEGDGLISYPNPY